MNLRYICAAVVGCSLAASTAASAHVTLEQSEAKVGGSYKAIFRVPHGCEGSPTLKIRAQVPEGVISAKPMPKAGWTLETVKGPYAKAYDYYGTPLTEGVKEIIWTGKLLDEHYDEFVFRGFLTEDLKAGTTLFFPVVQECEKGADRWIEIPAEGQDPEALESPAPGVKLLPK